MIKKIIMSCALVASSMVSASNNPQHTGVTPQQAALTIAVAVAMQTPTTSSKNALRKKMQANKRNQFGTPATRQQKNKRQFGASKPSTRNKTTTNFYI